MKNDEQISIKEAIHIFENSRLTSANFTPEAVTAAYVLALAALQEKAESPWINVKDRLPEERWNPVTDDFQKVICEVSFCGLTDVRTYGYGTVKGYDKPHFWHGCEIVDSYVTRWMPLPEPWKENDNE